MLTERVRQGSGKKSSEVYSMAGIREEVERQHRVIDMMLTMHAVLRDRYRLRGLFISVVLLCSAFVLVAGIFVNPDVLSKLRIGPRLVETVIRFCSLIVFLAALIEVRVDWRGQAERHEGAYKSLQKLKVNSKELLVDYSLNDEQIKDKWILINATLNEQYPIPEREFSKLKALHLRKVELSKMIGEHSGCPVLVLRMVLLCRSISKAREKKDN